MMVTRWGFSEELGAVSYGENQDEVFLGMSVARTQNVSEDTARKIDAEIKRLVEAAHDEARQVLEAKRNDLEALAKGLLEFETLTGDEITDLLAGKKPNRESVIEPQQPRSSAVPISACPVHRCQALWPITAPSWIGNVPDNSRREPRQDDNGLSWSKPPICSEPSNLESQIP